MKQAIQRVFSTRYGLAMLVAATLFAGAPQVAMAETAWNPMNWFSSQEAPEASAKDAVKQRVESAEQRAAEARQRAEQALKDAEEAQKELARVEREARQWEAEQARKHKASKVKPEKPRPEKPDKQKPVVQPPGEAATASAQPATGNKPGGKSDWNPLNWFSSPQTGAQQAAADDRTSTDVPAVAQQPASLPASPAEWSNEVLKTKAVQVSTEKGNFVFELYPDEAPLTVRNFVKLVDQKFYDNFNMKFHRVIPGFVIQTGDPTGTGAGGSKERIPLETKNKLTHDAKGVVAMARGPDPNSATSQFYVTLAPETTLDGKYAIFGRVISGLDVLEKIEKGDMLYGVTLVDINKVTRDVQPDKKGMFGMFGK